ncbi:MAG: DNA polymerase IV [Cellvibrionaceae bacterium]
MSDVSEPAQEGKKIIHCDCDCFFAAVEIRDDPSLQGRPVAVGGDPGKRGVLSTCNYEAREFGIHSAMPSAYAKRLCPDLIILPHNFEKYKQASAQIRNIFFDYTELVEPLSLDEAYLDVSQSDLCQGSGTLMAREIRQRVKEATGITISAGVAPNKFLAKIASDWRKPDGLFVITPDEVDGFVKKLPVKKIFGVGKVTARKLDRLGVETCGDLQDFSVFELTDHFGRFGKKLYDFARGIDDRNIEPVRKRKSLSVEHTFDHDLETLDQCYSRMPDLFVEFKGRLNRLNDEYHVTKSFVKLKFSDFSTTTLERSIKNPRIADYKPLLEQAWQRSDLGVRLIGIGVRFVDLTEQSEALQLPLSKEKDWR